MALLPKRQNCFLYHSQVCPIPSKKRKKEAGITIFLRSRTGITLTKDGAEFLGYARQVVQQMELLEDRYVTNLPGKVTFGVSSQHYTFTENAFVELVKRFG